MTGTRGQSLVELALCLPVVMVLGLGAVAVVQVVDASSGLQAATDAAVSAAARAPDSNTAGEAARASFDAVIADYPVRSPVLALTIHTFARGSDVTADSSGTVDVGWESLVLPARVQIGAGARMTVERWRTRR